MGRTIRRYRFGPGADSISVPEGNVTPVHLHDALTDGQSESGALTPLLTCYKGIEKVIHNISNYHRLYLNCRN